MGTGTRGRGRWDAGTWGFMDVGTYSVGLRDLGTGGRWDLGRRDLKTWGKDFFLSFLV